MSRKKPLTHQDGLDENNLAIFPFAKLGARDNRKVMEYEGWITDQDGRRIKQKWIVEGSPTRGLPDEFDERVIVALITITDKQNFLDPRVATTIYEILMVMGLDPHTKINYDHVSEALRKLTSVTIFTEYSFYDNRIKRWVSHEKGFNILDSYERTTSVEDEDGTRALQIGGIIWGQQIWDSLRSGYHKPLNLETYYRRLRTGTARKMYRLFDKYLLEADEYTIEVTDLAQRIGMSGNYEFASKVLYKLKGALNELVEHGCISSWDTVTRQRSIDVVVRREHLEPYQLNLNLLPDPTTVIADIPATEEVAFRFDVPIIVKELCYFGFSRQEATVLVEQHGEGYLRDCVRFMEQTFRVGKPPKNPADWLRKAIQLGTAS